jgi:hypothetical protein
MEVRMKKNLCPILIGLAALTVFASVNLTARDASAASSFCYQLSTFPAERIDLAIFKIKGLAIAPGQNAFTIDGKWVGTCGTDTMVTVAGSIVVSTKGTVTGAHLGLRSQTARTACVPLVLECTTTEVTPHPGTWFCRLRVESTGGTTTTFNLTQVTDSHDATCGVFEDGGTPPPAGAPPGSASGLIP